jgi:cytochrome b561
MTTTLTSRDKYSPVAQAAHWLTALLVALAWTLGVAGDEIPKGRYRDIAHFIHMSAGEMIVALLLLRLVWRVIDPPPPAEITPAGSKAALLATLMQIALYLLIAAVAVAGVTLNFAGGHPLPFFKLFEIASPWVRDHDFKEKMQDVHEALAHGLVILAGLHAGAALLHQYYFKDRVMARMLPDRLTREA